MLRTSVSLWSANLARLGDELKRMEPYTDWFHFDVADGHFAPSLLFFPDLVKALRPLTTKPFDVHLMVDRPEDHIPSFLEAGANVLIVHAELPQARECLEMIRKAGCKAGIGLRVETPAACVRDFLDIVDVVLLMGTKIGVKGKGIEPEAFDRVRALKKMVGESGRPVEILCDGGIRKETVPSLLEAGATFIVPGSLVFRGDPAENFAWIKNLPIT